MTIESNDTHACGPVGEPAGGCGTCGCGSGGCGSGGGGAGGVYTVSIGTPGGALPIGAPGSRTPTLADRLTRAARTFADIAAGAAGSASGEAARLLAKKEALETAAGLWAGFSNTAGPDLTDAYRQLETALTERRANSRAPGEADGYAMALDFVREAR